MALENVTKQNGSARALYILVHFCAVLACEVFIPYRAILVEPWFVYWRDTIKNDTAKDKWQKKRVIAPLRGHYSWIFVKWYVIKREILKRNKIFVHTTRQSANHVREFQLIPGVTNR